MMASMILFFTDLDETLVSREIDNLDVLKTFLSRLGIRSLVIPVTMKTFEEVLSLSRRLDFNFPIIVSEGGCVVGSLNEWFLPNTKCTFSIGNYHVGILCKSISEIDEIIEQSLEIHPCRNKITRMSKISANELQFILNMSYEEAMAATKRHCSEAFLSVDANCLKKLSGDLHERGLRVFTTEKVLHASTGSKGLGVSMILEKLKNYSHLVIAAGDSELDCEFLNLSDIPLSVGSGLVCIRKYPFVVSPFRPLTKNPILDKILLNMGL